MTSGAGGSRSLPVVCAGVAGGGPTVKRTPGIPGAPAVPGGLRPGGTACLATPRREGIQVGVETELGACRELLCWGLLTGRFSSGGLGLTTFAETGNRCWAGASTAWGAPQEFYRRGGE